MTPSTARICFAGFLCLIASAVPAAPVTGPYSIDFSTITPGDTTIPELIESPSPAWTMTPTGRLSVATGYFPEPFIPPTQRSAAVQVSNVADLDFDLSTRFTLSSFPASPTQGGLVGITALSKASNPWSANDNHQYHLVLMLTPTPSGPAGRLNLVEVINGRSTSLDVFSTEALPIVAGNTYDLLLHADQDDGELHFTAFASDGQSLIVLTAFDPTPLVGQYFGLSTMAYPQGAGTTGLSFTTEFHHLTLVPEPALTPLLAILLPLLHRPHPRGLLTSNH